MVRIAYGVCSDGMGHATRSEVVIRYLLSKGHKIYIFTSGRAYDFLSKKFSNIFKIPGFHLTYKDDKILPARTMMRVLGEIPQKTPSALQIIAKKFYDIKPDCVISDQESYTAVIGKYIGIPVIGTSNVSMASKGSLDIKSLDFLYPKLWIHAVEEMVSFKADHYVIPTFFFPKMKKKNIHLTHPVLRETVAKKTSKKGEHVLVYHTSSKFLKLLDLLTGIKEKFHVYGFGKRKNRKNLIFHEFNDTQFVKHLATAKAVITGGGFSLISEALHLKKPIFSIPLKNHFEQMMNGYYLQEKKFGEYSQKPTKVEIQDFLLKIPFYQYYLDQYSFDPTEYQRKIEQLMKKAVKAKKKKPKFILLKPFLLMKSPKSL